MRICVRNLPPPRFFLANHSPLMPRERRSRPTAPGNGVKNGPRARQNPLLGAEFYPGAIPVEALEESRAEEWRGSHSLTHCAPAPIEAAASSLVRSSISSTSTLAAGVTRRAPGPAAAGLSETRTMGPVASTTRHASACKRSGIRTCRHQNDMHECKAKREHQFDMNG